MPGATPIYGLPYPALTDAPNGPADIEALATAVEGELERIDADHSVSNVQNTLGQTNSTSFIEALSGGTPCAVTFVAPTSGKVIILFGAQMENALAAGNSITSFVLRTGGVVGSGTVVLAASDDRACIVSGVNPFRCGVAEVVTGLTPGATYNVRQAFRSLGGGIGTWQRKYLIVNPLP